MTDSSRIYKIRNKKGLYSTGGMHPKFTQKGKTWSSIGHVKSHLKQLWPRDTALAVYRGCVVVEIELVETTRTTRAIKELVQESKKRKKMLEKKYKKRQKVLMDRHFEELEAKKKALLDKSLVPTTYISPHPDLDSAFWGSR